MIWLKVASVMMFLAVALGAFGAHALKDVLSEYGKDVYQKAVFYHFVHALGLFAVAWLSTISQDPKVGFAGIAMLVGIIIFSGSLYVLALTGMKWLGALTPIGGLSFLTAWALLFLTKL